MIDWRELPRAERARYSAPVVVCSRHPDYSNEYQVFASPGQEPEIITMDYGYSNLRDPEEFEGWAGSMEGAAADLEKRDVDAESGDPNARAAAEFIRAMIEEARGEYQP